MNSKNSASVPALPARVLTLRPARRCCARNRSASSHDADHNGPCSDRANSMITERVLPTCPSLSPAAAIARTCWSTISCSKSSTSSAVRSASGEPTSRTAANLIDSSVHPGTTSVDHTDKSSRIPTNAQQIGFIRPTRPTCDKAPKTRRNPKRTQQHGDYPRNRVVSPSSCRCKGRRRKGLDTVGGLSVQPPGGSIGRCNAFSEGGRHGAPVGFCCWYSVLGGGA